MENIYSPSDDSYFFSEFLDSYLPKIEGSIDFLDMGTGSGILCETALKHLDKESILAADSNPVAVSFVSGKGFSVVQSDLFSHIKGSFDLIVFNAPYLPLDKREPVDSRLATTGGVKGDEVSVRFLEEAFNHLNIGGHILLLVSSLTPMDRISHFNPVEVARKKISFEELIIHEFSK